MYEETRNQRWQTPLHQAACDLDVARCAELLSLGADLEARDDGGETPLATAVSRDRPVRVCLPVIRLLLAAGADVNALDMQGRTPLHGAAGAGRAMIIRVLLDAGAKPGIEDDGGLTPRDRLGKYLGWDKVREGEAKSARERRLWSLLHRMRELETSAEEGR